MQKARGYALADSLKFYFASSLPGGNSNIEDFPVYAWVSLVSKGEAEYISTPKTNKKRKATFFEGRKKK